MPSACAPPPKAASPPRPTSPTGWCAPPGVPFREAHHIVGRVVRAADRAGCMLSELPLAELRAIDPRLTEDALAMLTVDASVNSRISEGGTAPSRVKAAVAAARRRYL